MRINQAIGVIRKRPFMIDIWASCFHVFSVVESTYGDLSWLVSRAMIFFASSLKAALLSSIPPLLLLLSVLVVVVVLELVSSLLLLLLTVVVSPLPSIEDAVEKKDEDFCEGKRGVDCTV